ncbi:hypothetical protein ABW20_dc0105979 [Dactylellina cionopaga]|nr:hypothetical protein ABW20_dc0105979 [Dactylellina cionopaga]
MAFYSSNTDIYPLDPPPANNAPPARRLVILGLPVPRRGVEFAEPLPMDKDGLDTLTQKLQTFEYHIPNEQVPNEIVLFKPPSLRVSQSRFDQLFKELNTAFLGPQLKAYLAATGVNIAGGGVKRLRKEEALKMVLRQVWKVEIAEEIAAEMDVIREKELSFRPMDLFFMMDEGGDMLQKLASSNRTRIVLNSSNNKVVLEGTKLAIEEIEGALNAVPDMLVDKSVDISALLRVGSVNENYIPSISRLTKVFLEVKDNRMSLHAANPEDAPNGWSNIEDAQRLLFNSVDLHLRETHSLLGETQSMTPLTGALYPVSEDQTLPWMYRGRNWCRWRSIREPIRYNNNSFIADDEEVSVSNSTPLVNPHRGDSITYSDIRALLDSPSTSPSSQPSVDPASTSPNPPSISPSAETSTTYHAILGQILHSSPTLPTVREPKSLSDLLTADPSHVLCNSVPRIIDFLSTLNPITYTYDFKLLLKFSPSPWKQPENFERLPPVEMELRVDPETNEILRIRLTAVDSHGITDVLMPRNTCDLRFVRRKMTKIESRTDEIRRYLESASLDILGEERLKGGEELVMKIPRWMLGETVEDGKEANETVPITYFFTGLETRSSTTFDFEGAPLMYTKVEAGASGGSYDEIILECQKDEIEYLTPLEEARLGRDDEIAAAEKQKVRDEEIRKFLTEEDAEDNRFREEREEWNKHVQYRENDIKSPVFSSGGEGAAVEVAAPLPEEEVEDDRREAFEEDFDEDEEEKRRKSMEALLDDVLKREVAETIEKIDERVENEASTKKAPLSDLRGMEFLFGAEEGEVVIPIASNTSSKSAAMSEESLESTSLSSIEENNIELAIETLAEEKNITVHDSKEHDGISNAVFQRFVTTARKLVEAVENIDTSRERMRRKKL